MGAPETKAGPPDNLDDGINPLLQGNWRAALQILEDMRKSRIRDPDGSVWSAVVWACEVSFVPAPGPAEPLRILCPKQHSVAQFVKSHATKGDLNSVLNAIETFAKQKSWLKIMGGAKRGLLEGTLQKGDRVVECGTFVGFSALVIVRRLRELGGNFTVNTLEVDAGTATCARQVIEWAGADQEVSVHVGCAGDWISTGLLGNIDLLILDHRGTVYHEDLHVAEEFLSPGARVFADNVFYPGAPLFLHYIDVMNYTVKIHDLKEYLKSELDDWVVVCSPHPIKEEIGPVPCNVPEKLLKLSSEIDQFSWKSQRQVVDWQSFQKRVSPVLLEWREKVGL